MVQIVKFNNHAIDPWNICIEKFGTNIMQLPCITISFVKMQNRISNVISRYYNKGNALHNNNYRTIMKENNEMRNNGCGTRI